MAATETQSPNGSAPAAITRSWRQWWPSALMLALFAASLLAIHHLLQEFSYAHLRHALHAIHPHQFGLALLATLGSYLCLTGYDWSALSWLGKRLPYPQVARAAICSYAISNTVGLSLLSGGAVRYRLYANQGLDGADIAQLSAFSALAFGLGMLTLSGLTLAVSPTVVGRAIGMDPLLVRTLALLALGAVAALVASCHFRRTPLVFANLRVTLPGGGLMARQLAISVLDLLCSALVLWSLLPDGMRPTGGFLAAYAAATAAAVLSHVPGGVGVFEAVMLLALGKTVNPASLGVALICYRAIYYLLPLVLAGAYVGYGAVVQNFDQLRRRSRGAARLGGSLAPFIASTLCFLSGVVLLWSVVTPAVPHRLARLEAFLPLVVLESSHFLAAASGAGLLIVAQGLRRKLNGALALAIGLALLGTLAALAKGNDFEESLLLLGLAAFLYGTRSRFYRRTALINAALSGNTLLGMLCCLLGMTLLFAFSWKHVAYAHALWWQFEFGNEVSRALRGVAVAATAAMVWGIWRLLRPPPPAIALPGEPELTEAEAIVRAQPHSEGWLALVGDKHLLFDAGHKSFVMYGVRGQSWIALGDPVGPRDLQEEAAWRFRELADQYGGRVAFYQVRAANLPLYVDMGLTPYKLGDEAVIDLAQFSLEGAARKALRQSVSRAEREGLSFAIVPQREVAALMPRLAAVSEIWLRSRQTREKGYSLGYFLPAYIARGDLALVRKGEDILAFANLMPAAPGGELSIDLMRHVVGVPNVTMLYLFVQLMLYARDAGYGSFSLGMAPLSGLETHPLAPLWHRFGHLVYDRGERFYNFQGLRLFKDKFDPSWEPRYLVCPAGLAPLTVMIDVTAIIAGGVAGVIAR